MGAIKALPGWPTVQPPEDSNLRFPRASATLEVTLEVGSMLFLQATLDNVRGKIAARGASGAAARGDGARLNGAPTAKEKAEAAALYNSTDARRWSPQNVIPSEGSPPTGQT